MQTRVFACILCALCLFAIADLGCKGEKKKPVKQPDKLLPGEKRSPELPNPYIVHVVDTSCTDDLTCPARGSGCVLKDFTVELDTTYLLTTAYFSMTAGTLEASCRTCATVLQDTSVIIQRITPCPTGGPWTSGVRLQPGIKYTLSVCLQRCPELEHCECGEAYQADGIVSIRQMFR